MITRLADGRYEWTRRIRRRGSLQDLRRLERRVDDALDKVDRAARPRDLSILDALDAYLDHCRDNELSQDTIRQYRRELGELHRLLGGGTIGRVSVEVLDHARHALRRRNSPATVNRKIGLLKRLARWAAHTGRWAADPRLVDWLTLPGLRTTRRRQTVLTIVELVDVIDSLPEHLREILTLALLTAARPRAILTATWSDVIWPTQTVPGVIRFPTLKRGIDGAVMYLESSEIHESLLRARELWRSCRRAAGRSARYPRAGRYRDPLYITRRRGEAWTVSALDREVKRYLSLAGYSDAGVTPYTIRRSVLTAAWHMGGTAGEVQAVAKHRAFSNTERYIVEQSPALTLRRRLEQEYRHARGG